MAEVGGVRSSDDPVPDLWWFGEHAGERRDATCSAGVKRNDGLATALWAISAKNVLDLQLTLAPRPMGAGARNSESRMRENRPSGLMRGGEQTVIGLVPLNPSLPAYSTPTRIPAVEHEARPLAPPAARPLGEERITGLKRESLRDGGFVPATVD